MDKVMLLAMLLPAKAYGNRAVMEGIPATNNAVSISTGGSSVNGGAVMLMANATSYNGGISSVGVYVGSNVVVSNTNTTNNCVIYSSGSATCLEIRGNTVVSGNVPVLVSSTNITTAVNASTFTVLASSTMYHGFGVFKKDGTASNMWIRFNDDTTSGNYSYACNGDRGASGADNIQSDSAVGCAAQVGSNTLGANADETVRIEALSTIIGDTTKVEILYTTGGFGNASSQGVLSCSCRYSGSASLTKISFGATSANFIGWWRIDKMDTFQ